MAGQVIDDDPQLAHEHALAAMRHAGRVAVARETLAVTAYAIGDFALALRELRTYRRITGRNDHVAMIVDSERGIGRPEKALEEGRGADRDALPVAQRVELAIAMSGARLDLGQTELALHELDIPELDPDRAYEWSAGLFAARALVLEDLGRGDEAAEWARRAEIADAVIAEKLAEDDTILVEEIAFASDEPEDASVSRDAHETEGDVVDGRGDPSEEDASAQSAADPDASVDVSAATSVPAAARRDEPAGAAPVEAPSEETPEDAGAETPAAARADDEHAPIRPVAYAEAARDESSTSAREDAPSDDELEPVDDQTIEDEVTAILAEAGIADDDAAGSAADQEG
ncbi:hypothetical protein [Microbacterium sp. gxy059]|uniref:hypothetical protein n=1 Tax=Microbacterium sp. gxy059 TaxID=2957199 RepID=UPI003D97E626